MARRGRRPRGISDEDLDRIDEMAPEPMTVRQASLEELLALEGLINHKRLTRGFVRNSVENQTSGKIKTKVSY